MYKAKEIEFTPGVKGGKVSGLVSLPKGAKTVLVLAHGAGAGMRHKFMDQVAAKLADRGVATFRYQFPYMENVLKGRTASQFSPTAFARLSRPQRNMPMPYRFSRAANPWAAG